jgi:soluble lytic murein transglycosylase-like protein
MRDVFHNGRIGVELLDEFGSPEVALAAYNGGPADTGSDLAV